MSVTIDWMDSRYSVIHANFVDHWDWGELRQALVKSHNLMTKSSRHVTLMLDFVGSVKASKTDVLISFDDVQVPQNLTRLVIISDDPMLSRKMEGTLSKIYPEAEEIRSAINHEMAFTMVRQTLEVPAINVD
jgi:hypothetical protein